MIHFSFSNWLNFEEGRLPTDNTVFSQVNQPFEDYETAKSMAEERLPEFKAHLEYVLRKGAKGQGEVVTNIKSEKSTVDKLNRGKTLSSVADILRATIVIDGDPKLVKKTASAMFTTPKYPVVKYEAKSAPRTNDRLGYFGSYNIDIEINGMVCEVQIMTRRLYRRKDSLHSNFYAPYRAAPEALPSDQGRISRKGYNRANDPIPIENPKVLKKLGLNQKSRRKSWDESN